MKQIMKMMNCLHICACVRGCVCVCVCVCVLACADDSVVVSMNGCVCMCERSPSSFNTAPHSCIHKSYMTDLLYMDWNFSPRGIQK